ncbi:phage integrase SAM-like domain-containing protein [Fibrobacter sp. UWT3]|uniref:phage integrase SAM-like domain-containing protein n=1 Tax=Fibrobacter sp. UWT3 TaxID=1896225 RepID=UPI000BE37207
MLFHDVALNYLEQDKENLAPLTVRTYYWNLKKIQYFRPDLECTDINEQMVRDFRRLCQSGSNETSNKSVNIAGSLDFIGFACLI